MGLANRIPKPTDISKYNRGVTWEGHSEEATQAHRITQPRRRTDDHSPPLFSVRGWVCLCICLCVWQLDVLLDIRWKGGMEKRRVICELKSSQHITTK